MFRQHYKCASVHEIFLEGKKTFLFKRIIITSLETYADASIMHMSFLCSRNRVIIIVSE